MSDVLDCFSTLFKTYPRLTSIKVTKTLTIIIIYTYTTHTDLNAYTSEKFKTLAELLTFLEINLYK